MGLKSEYSYDVFEGDDEFYEYSDEDGENINFSFDDWCDLNSTELLNEWFTLQENAQLYYKLNQNITFTDYCRFMYSDPSCEEDLDKDTSLDSWNLWYSIGKPKTYLDFYKFYC